MLKLAQLVLAQAKHLPHHAVEAPGQELGPAAAAFAIAFLGAALFAYSLGRLWRPAPTFERCRRSMPPVAVDGGQSGFRLRKRGVA